MRIGFFIIGFFIILLAGCTGDPITVTVDPCILADYMSHGSIVFLPEEQVVIDDILSDCTAGTTPTLQQTNDLIAIANKYEEQ